MIVTYLQNGFEAVLQRHHARLAASLMANLIWVKEDPNKIDLILAAANHDNDYTEFRREGLLNDLGGPKDFKMETFDKADCERLLDEANASSTFIAILIAFHMQFVQRGLSSAATRFCNALETSKQRWCKDVGLSMATMEKYYTMLQWCDALSLLICQRMVPPEGRSLAISDGPDGVTYFISAVHEDTYTIEPWPFAVDNFALAIERRLLDKLAFKSDRELQEALKISPVTVQHVAFEVRS
ncbi:DUF3891 family protein [Sphingobacterium deserti]|uniref:DUF3891 domain-containing protein n=1 Tax=Sphingobacterium deserti TaxID=1229276 RepID=A0A0B8T1L2_9SPHI|nr:DUF3891 family protein [Sphingobacterium deserti]KGE12563.1 hypothetical protein DI53_3603 [Sphingobacterium deserti]